MFNIANYIRRNRFILSEINNKTFDILTFTIENIKYQNKSTRKLIEFIYDEFQYENINYTIVFKNITKTPLLYEYITDLLNAYKNKIPLTNNQIFQCLNQVKYHFKICQDWYEKVIVTLDEDTIIKNKLTFTKTVNYEVLKFLLLYEKDKNEAILKRINRNLIYEAIIQDYRYNLNLDKNLNIFKEFLEIDLNNNHYKTFENNLKLIKYSNKYFLITIIMNTIKKQRIEEILKWIVYFEEVVLSKSNVNDILIKLIEYFYKDEKNENLKSFDRILNILFENKIFNPNIDFENIIKVCIKNRKIYLINKIIISTKHSLPKEIIKNIKFEKILLELIKNVDITYDIFHLLWNLIFNNQNIDLEQFKFEEIIVSDTNNYIIGKQIIQIAKRKIISSSYEVSKPPRFCVTLYTYPNQTKSLYNRVTNMYENNKINKKYYKIIKGNLKLNKNKNKNLNVYINKKGKVNIEDKFNNSKVIDKPLNITKFNTGIGNNIQLKMNTYDNNNNNNNNYNFNNNNYNIYNNNNYFILHLYLLVYI
ncbi:hypothetical protein U3516DRAFT_786265 [Neocallimastix sp. 'constans']